MRHLSPRQIPAVFQPRSANVTRSLHPMNIERFRGLVFHARSTKPTLHRDFVTTVLQQKRQSEGRSAHVIGSKRDVVISEEVAPSGRRGWLSGLRGRRTPSRH